MFNVVEHYPAAQMVRDSNMWLNPELIPHLNGRSSHLLLILSQYNFSALAYYNHRPASYAVAVFCLKIDYPFCV